MDKQELYVRSIMCTSCLAKLDAGYEFVFCESASKEVQEQQIDLYLRLNGIEERLLRR